MSVTNRNAVAANATGVEIMPGSGDGSLEDAAVEDAGKYSIFKRR